MYDYNCIEFGKGHQHTDPYVFVKNVGFFFFYSKDHTPSVVRLMAQCLITMLTLRECPYLHHFLLKQGFPGAGGGGR